MIGRRLESFYTWVSGCESLSMVLTVYKQMISNLYTVVWDIEDVYDFFKEGDQMFTEIINIFCSTTLSVDSTYFV